MCVCIVPSSNRPSLPLGPSAMVVSLFNTLSYYGISRHFSRAHSGRDFRQLVTHVITTHAPVEFAAHRLGTCMTWLLNGPSSRTIHLFLTLLIVSFYPLCCAVRVLTTWSVGQKAGPATRKQGKSCKNVCANRNCDACATQK